MEIALIDCDDGNVQDLERALTASGATATTIPLDKANSTSLEKFSGIVISGGGQLVTEESDAFFDKFDFLDSVSCPVLGICLGHQVLALRNGAVASIGTEQSGPEPLKILAPHPLFKGIASETVFTESHRESVTLPSNYRLLATSNSCQVEAIAAHDRPFFGVQFHPERSGEQGVVLFKNFLAMLRPAV